MRMQARFSEFLEKQWELFEYEPQGKVSIEGIFGGYGSGKTVGAARKFVKRCCQHGWHEGYGTRRPQAVVMAPTSRILKKATVPALEEALPSEMILQRKGMPHPSFLLTNGVEISLVSGEAGFEGEDLILMWVDEISHRVFQDKITNYLARLRDPNARAPMTFLVSGIPESGWLREMFDREGKDRITLLCGTRDNPYIPKETLEQILAMVPAGYESSLVGGGWMLPPDAVFSQYNEDQHLTDDMGDEERPTSLGIDIGNHGAVIFGQPVKMSSRNIVGQVSTKPGVLVVDELITRDQSVREMCERIKTEKPWIIAPRRSVICVDPMIRRDELKAIRQNFHEVKIVKRTRGHELHPIESGIRILQSSLSDAQGNATLRFSRRLCGQKHGVLDAITSARRHTMTQRVVKDDSRDHCLDACRYLVAELNRPDPPSWRVL